MTSVAAWKAAGSYFDFKGTKSSSGKTAAEMLLRSFWSMAFPVLRGITI
jgi:hypothetical protein